MKWRVTLCGVPATCAQCSAQLPRPLPGPGRLPVYCTPACRQKAYRTRGGQASGTTGAQRARHAARQAQRSAEDTP